MLHQRTLFLQNNAQTSDFPLLLEIERAEGVFMFGPNGKRYIDLISGIAVSNVGHRHPVVLEAIQNQLDKYLHLMVYGEILQSPQVTLAQTLLGTMPNLGPDCFYFVNSGSEAIEGAMKLAKRYTGRMEFISADNAYHGSSQGALSIGGNEVFKQAFRPLLPGISQIRFGIIEDLNKITDKTAAVLIETIQGEAGVKVPTMDYMKALREACTNSGALLVLDEIQCGAGRTGTFWAFEAFGIVPDILVSAKGIGGGMPIGFFAAKQEVMSVFKTNPILGHITTFGGHPVSCVAAEATVKIIQEPGLRENVIARGNQFRELLVHPSIKEIRGKGLMLAAEFENFETLKKIIDKGLEIGVLTDWFLFCDNSMRIAPPLTISEEEVTWACKLILEAIDVA